MYKETGEQKQMFIDLVQCHIYVFVKIDKENNVILRKEGTDKLIKCPRHKFTTLFTPLTD